MRKITWVLMFVAMMVGISCTWVTEYDKVLAQSFGYNVGDTFVVEGYTFKIVNKEARQAVSVNVLTTANWETATDFAAGFAIRNSSYINSSGLPSMNDYLNATWRTNVGTLTIDQEWTSDQYTIGVSYYYWVGNYVSVAGVPMHHPYNVRPALYLKPGLAISGPGGTLSVDTTPPAAPTANVATGLYNTNKSVTLTGEAGATIRYTTNGTTPTTGSTVYSSALTISTTTTLKAMQWDAAGNASPVATYIYTIDKIAPVAPTANVATGLYNTNKSVTLTGEAGATIRYTTNGTTPTTGSTVYSSALTISTTTTLKAMQWDAAGNASPVATYTYTIDTTPPDAPTFSTTPGTTLPTNQDIIVIINYPDDATTKQYKIGSGPWIEYTTSILMITNGTIYTLAKDAAQNENTSASLSINNIDKIVPTATVSYSTIVTTNQDVIATITPSEAITITNNSGLMTYTFTSNTTFTFNFIDVAGNIGSVTAEVTNIDKDAPEMPTFSVSSTGPTEEAIVTITYPVDASIKEYKTHSGEWLIYTEPLLINKNGTIYARCKDEAGNESTEASLSIGNIEKNGSVEGIELDDRKYFKYYLGLGNNKITQCMLVAGRNPDGTFKRDFGKNDIIDDTNHFKKGILYIDIYGKIKLY